MRRSLQHFIRLAGMSHVRTSPYYPQSKSSGPAEIERFHKTIKSEGIRPNTPLSLADAIDVITNFIEDYNTKRLHSAIGYVTPEDRLLRKHLEIFAKRDRKLDAARETRRQNRARLRTPDEQPLGAAHAAL